MYDFVHGGGVREIPVHFTTELGEKRE
jgi:hypothetical protein